MVRQTTVISIFLASPSDVLPERTLVINKISQWNTIRGRNRGVTLNVLSWENNTSAGIGLDGQDVVNGQIGDEYDAMIGLFWGKVGSPTPRAVSGTAEEYERALKRRADGEAIEIGIYFKSDALPMDSIDPEQIRGLFDLKEKLQKDGIYHKSFVDETSLGFEVDLFLENLVEKLIRSDSSVAIYDVKNMPEGFISNTPEISSGSSSDDLDDIGYLDILDELEQYNQDSTSFLSVITEQLAHISSVVTRGGQKLSELSAMGPVDSGELRKITKQATESFDDFSEKIENGIGNYSVSSQGIAQSSLKLIRVSVDFEQKEDDVSAARESLISLSESIRGAVSGMRGFAETVSGLQRMTTEFNRSRRRLVSNVNALIKIMESTEQIVQEALEQLPVQ